MTVKSILNRCPRTSFFYINPVTTGRNSLYAVLCLTMFLSCDSPTSEDDSKQLHITLAYKGPVYKGNYYSPDYLPSTDWAVWIADASNRYIKTLKINIGVAKLIIDSASRANHLPAWLDCTGDSINDSPDQGPVPERFDGITAASFLFDQWLADTTVTIPWDFTDTSGTTVPEGTYYYWAEVANMEKDSASNTEGYIMNLISETATGSVQYPSGVTTSGSSTANILSFTGVVE